MELESTSTGAVMNEPIAGRARKMKNAAYPEGGESRSPKLGFKLTRDTMKDLLRPRQAKSVSCRELTVVSEG